MKRRFIAVLLATVLAVGSNMPVFAGEIGEGSAENETENAAGEEILMPETTEVPEKVVEAMEEEGAADNQGADAVEAQSLEEPVEAAESEEIVTAETFSEVDENGLKWEVADGVLTISGNGVIERNVSLNTSIYINDKEIIRSDTISSIDIREGIVGIGKDAFVYFRGLKSVSIAGSVEEIGEEAFAQCNALTSVVISTGVTRIGNGAFSGCSALTNVIIPTSVTKIGERAFDDCYALASIDIPASVTEIGKEAFAGCTALTSVVMPAGVTKIEERIFAGCNALTSVVIPTSVTEIGEEAFNSTSLTSISIPENVTEIGESAFVGCKKLRKVTIPESVRAIGIWAFLYCTELQTITFKGDAPEIPRYESDYDEPFKNVAATAYYPAGNPTYTEEVKAAFGSDLTWVAKEMSKMSFTDVTDADWYYDAADFVFSRGIMTGMNDTEFGPSVKLSRAQFVTILYRMEGEPEVAYDAAAFPDVTEGQFYTKAAMWAKSSGVISGYEDGRFGPADEITREQMAVMMYRYADKLGLDISAEGDMSVFPDAERISPFANKEVKWTVGEGLIKGDGGNINPQGTAERAQCATIIMRFMEGYGL